MNNICKGCNKSNDNIKFKYCSHCRKIRLKASKKYYNKVKDSLEFKEKQKKKNMDYYQKNRENLLVKHKEYYNQNKDKWKRSPTDKKKRKARYYELKIVVFNHYGNICNCCGEKHIEFLTIDHINGIPEGEKRISGIRLFRQIIKEKFPKTYQILCFNCNNSKSLYGYCPHKNNN